MRIGLVLPSVPGYSETFFVNKIRGLRAQGHEVVLFVNSETCQKSFENAPVVPAPKFSKNPVIFLKNCLSFLFLLFFHFKTVKRFFHLEKGDEIPFFQIVKRFFLGGHILSQKLDWLHFGFGTVALEKENIAGAIGAKLAVSFRGFDIGIYPLKNPNCYKKLWTNVDRVHVISDDIADLVFQNGFRDKEKIVKICPAIDTNLFNARELARSNSVIQILTIGRLHWKKGLEYTLEALALVGQREINFHYTIIGDGFEKERLQFAAHQLGLTNNVTFAGKLSPAEVKSRLERSDLYLQYSIQEGFCNAVLEAQAMGKICIVSDAEGLAENVLDGVTGFVVPRRNPISLAKKILEILKISKLEKLIIEENAIRRINKEFTLEKQGRDFLDFYNY